MVLVAKAIVDKCTMMVKALYTFVAVVTVHSVLWSKVFTVYANVI